MSVKLGPYRYCSNILIPKISDNASFSTCEQLHLLVDKVLDANATGRSVQSGMVCEITAPNPYAEASPASDMGRSGL